MNKQLWKNRNFSDSNPLNYPCPNCEAGILKLKKKIDQITPTGRIHEEYNSGEGIEYVFSAILECKNCNETISFSGYCLKNIADADELPDGRLVEKRFHSYYPKYFFPNLKMIKVPEKITSEVKEQINLSFSVYFIDLSSCANKIRNAIELILDDLKAPSKRRTKKGKLESFPNLHQRIEHFAKRNKTIGILLLALKIIGNNGSHKGQIRTDDILKAYEILEELIDYTYFDKRKNALKLASEVINDQKTK